MITTTSRARSRLARRLSWLVVLALTSAALFVPAASPALAAAPNPNYESGAPGITVDGNLSEWTAADFFANMHRAGKADKQIESKLYLRYNCGTGILYVMVETENDVNLAAGGDNFVKIDGVKKVGSPNVGNYTPNADDEGWEASFALGAGNYDLDVHTQVEDGGSQTSALVDRSAPLTIACPVVTPSPTPTPTPTPTPVVTPSPTPTPVVTPSPTPVVTPSPTPTPTPTPVVTPSPTPVDAQPDADADAGRHAQPDADADAGRHAQPDAGRHAQPDPDADPHAAADRGASSREHPHRQGRQQRHARSGRRRPPGWRRVRGLPRRR